MADLNVRRYLPYVFNYQTTMRTDYQPPPIMPDTPKVNKPEIKCLRPRPPPLKDAQTLCPRHPRTAYVPFNLYHKHKLITDTAPSDIQKPFYKLQDVACKEVQKTRPRVYMTPAISLDDVDEPARQILVKSVYTTEVKEAMKCAVLPSEHVKAPLSEVYAPSNVIKLPILRQPYVSPEWRMQSASWDRNQLRGYVDPTETFWLNMKSKCQECKDTAARKAQRKMLRGC